jgi:cytochrome P450
MMLPPSDRVPPCPIDFLADGFTRDRLAAYATIRQAGPIVWYRPTHGFLVTGYRDTLSLLRDHRLAEPDIFLAWHKLGPKLGRDYSDALEFFTYFPFRHEGQRHTQLRRAMAIGLAPYLGGHPAIGRCIERRLSPIRAAGGFDLAGEFGNFLFFDVVCDLLGIDPDQREYIRPIASMSRLLEWTLPASFRSSFADHIGAYLLVLEEHVARALRAEAPGFFTSAYNGLPAEEPQKLKATAILAAILMMMGNDAIGGCISFTTADLLQPGGAAARPAQAAWGTIADEAIRFASPVDLLTRVAEDDVEVAGCSIAKGEALIFSLLCANHDPAEFGEFAGAVTEKANSASGIAFGAGAHLCVGNRLSRVVVAEAFEALAQLPAMRLAGEVVYGPGRVVRTVASLPVEFH